MKGIFYDIYHWTVDVALVVRRQFRLTFTDAGVMIFFLFLPLVYPIIYSLIYTTEVTRDMPVVVVDNCRSAMSREFVRHADATEAIKIAGYAANLQEARRAMAEHKCYGILEIPEDYSRHLGRGEQAVVHFYADMGLLYRYRTFLMSLTDLQMATCTELREIALNTVGMPDNRAPSQVTPQAYMLGDTQQGFGSFILPGIVVLILQQSLLLGIAMLDGAGNERRRIYGYDPCQIDCSASATVTGKALAFSFIYFPLTVYILHYIPEMFHFPHVGVPLQYFTLMLPMLLATACLGIALQGMMRERESSFVVIVFTSVVFLFLSGLTWPRYAMGWGYTLLGDMVPATWAIQGFIQMDSTGGTMSEQSTQYLWLWGLVVFYFVIALAVTRYRESRFPVPRTSPVTGG